MAEEKKTNYAVVVIVAVLIVAAFVIPRVMRPGRMVTDGGTGNPPATIRVPTGSTTFDEAAAQAKAENKRMYVEFSAAWCPACAQFRKEVLADPAVKEALKRVVHVDVDLDNATKLAEQFGVTGVPAGFLLKVNGTSLQVLDRHEGMLDKQQFLEFIARKG